MRRVQIWHSSSGTGSRVFRLGTRSRAKALKEVERLLNKKRHVTVVHPPPDMLSTAGEVLLKCSQRSYRGLPAWREDLEEARPASAEGRLRKVLTEAAEPMTSASMARKLHRSRGYTRKLLRSLGDDVRRVEQVGLATTYELVREAPT